jgi:TatD DNase family protein
MLVDSHCHLDFLDFADNRDEFVERARRAGVGRIVTIGTRPSQFDGVRAIAEAYSDVFCSVGVHPHNAGEEGLSEPEFLLEQAKHPKVVGIGESGLDYFYDKAPRDRQAESFRVHIEAARETGLPLIVHTRDADDDTIAILKEGHEAGAFPCVIHCFTASQKLADACLAMGHYISFSGILTFKSATNIHEVAKVIPADRMLVETDSPYLAPVPKRGKSNEPSYVAHTAAFLAELRGMDYQTLLNQTGENFFRLFSKVPSGEL